MVVFLGFLAGFGTIFGAYLVLAKKKWAEKNISLLLSFAAGILLSFCFGHLLPEANGLFERSFAVVLWSFFVFYVLEHLLLIHSHHGCEGCEEHGVRGLMSVLGLGLHSLIDGLVIGAGFEVSPRMGFLAAGAVLAHEVPEGISAASVLLAGGYSLKRIKIVSFLVAMATPLGAILGMMIFRETGSWVLGGFLALAAGSFLYIAAADLIPEIHRRRSWKNILAVLGGMLLPFLIN